MPATIAVLVRTNRGTLSSEDMKIVDAAARGYGPEADVWAIGNLMFEIKYGKPAFDVDQRIYRFVSAKMLFEIWQAQLRREFTVAGFPHDDPVCPTRRLLFPSALHLVLTVLNDNIRHEHASCGWYPSMLACL